MTDFTLYPAIDLKDGQCVRLIQGDMEQATVFNSTPADQASQFEEMGFKYLHVVDLNGAFAGESRNRESVSEILKTVSMPVQLGGGIRTREHVENWLDAGISRLILGTIAARDPDFVKECAAAYPGKIAVGIDASDGFVAVEGWAEVSTLKAVDLAKAFADSGVAAIIVTDIGRDGLKTGVNVDLTASLADAVPIPVIASGGVRSVEDITNLRASSAPISGSILGRALYDGDIIPAEALKAATC
ncbi:1-(5-phosphoribosyl)-5-[(5-phosphoribosylamino)methylideneamino]imidazole-4-carboxamide isomerase [Ponticaulis sp.]|uniref:1-(5-phosphoribosyl)-5-[(5- phosphoribosylamino)methylideneamino]imidazole-4- carboxamide isomerase n=1 Tax=Ponticaulis sp. TaxID=2020902 RepID=UPI000B63DD6E|nr:1-(5-phosphoribosyl)-5-[(5-phosphoribosylamino)methylideneamino]imidazole-4-carboxamide isomerase [Ponticaulis sp.]MAI91030.1 1-(5-phosphoribosyl)-5-[(5-phosphoribosylamino)methylideneamino]imidazole-4-carboxamide isomerase [Ponticaulis sp.]OUX98590.1 MAG: 1-(5-phosphoribosyl)-5-[(5-phosphoribosylamino)methylideneamino]imidazole-4-carboxamide isomerase [Hyphomonadaceae bacterium TMED5]